MINNLIIKRPKQSASISGTDEEELCDWVARRRRENLPNRNVPNLTIFHDCDGPESKSGKVGDNQ